MEQKLFIELYNFVGDVNTLLSNLSAENFESADIAGVVESIEKLYDIVEREGMRRLELIKVDKTPDDYHDSGSNSQFNINTCCKECWFESENYQAYLRDTGQV